MNLYDYTHIRVKYEKSSRLFGELIPDAAYRNDDILTVSVKVPQSLHARFACMHLYRDDDMSTRVINAPHAYSDGEDDAFSVTLELSECCLDGESGLFYYTFGLETPCGTLYTCRDGRVTDNLYAVSSAQLLVYKKEAYTPEKFRGGMMYQIFVDRFYDGGRKITPTGEKVLNPDWECGTPAYPENSGDKFSNNEFFGGNLWGVADKLDYIASLGADILYLCPIFESASNHKYDTGDYERVDAMFGGDEALSHLISECKKRGMKLILDGVFNHTGADSKYFNKYGNYGAGGAYNTPDSPYFEWYSFRAYPEKYRCWWGIDILPSVKGDNPSWREYICGENGIIRKYLRMGIDGWRLDVADELSDVFIEDIKRAARAERGDALIIGEVWENASNKVAYDKRRRYFRGDQLDSVMNYPLKEAVIDYIMTEDSTRLCSVAKELWEHYPRHVSHALMNFLGTHDTERILTVLSGENTGSMTNRELAEYRMSSDKRQLAKGRLMLAWTLLAAFPGIPCIYYGDEAGMEGGRDPFNRRPYIWGREDGGITEHYRLIGKVRKEEPIFAYGDMKIWDTGNPARFLMGREYEGRRLFVAVNLSGEDWSLSLDGKFRRLLSCGGDTVKAMSAEYFVCDE